MLSVGQSAPVFSRIAHNGTEVVVGPNQGKVMVVYFYPKDETPLCIAEACAFRDSFADFSDAGAVVVGISDDSDESHRKFAEKRRLPFALVSDEGGTLRKSFEIADWLGLVRNRVTFVIDQEGIIRHRFEAKLRAQKHVEEAIRVVRELVGPR